ncbi:MAG: ribose 5-phosphate isomerase B [Acidobacteria bacterium RIFCSPLOWO2_02_FULL_59_13]|nr:MAG: ribose 5-phosphate isomerase B [Acidobacteria bacterium RIFCSPLOWO2_02_FULL_59_13]
MRIVIGADHAGFDLKKPIVEQIQSAGHTAIDVGTHNHDPVDYPDLSRAVCQAILQGKADLGIIICGSGVGAAVAANKFPGIRAAVSHDTYSARQGREHDDVNVLCLGARVIGPALAEEIIKTWLQATFSGLPRHKRRLDKIAEIEKEFSLEPRPLTK